MSKDINLVTHITDIVNLIKWEGLNNICLVAHSYAGWPGSGALEQIGDRVSSIVWVDAFKPDDGQRAIDVVNETIRKAALNAADKGEPGLPPAPAALFLVNEKDRAYVDSKLTPQPVGTYLQPIKLSGARDKVAKKTYIRATRFQAPRFQQGPGGGYTIDTRESEFSEATAAPGSRPVAAVAMFGSSPSSPPTRL